MSKRWASAHRRDHRVGGAGLGLVGEGDAGHDAVEHATPEHANLADGGRHARHVAFEEWTDAGHVSR